MSVDILIRPDPRPPLSRLVGGCYVQEIAHDLGFLLLQSSVLSGLEREDSFHYVPDESLIPVDAELHTEKLVDVLGESRELVRLAVHTASSRLESVVIEDPERLIEMPAISLARLAQSFRPTCLQTAFTVAANEIRAGHYRLAETTLLRASEFLVTPSDKSRWYRNRAAGQHRVGNLVGAVQFAKSAVHANPSDIVARQDYRDYLADYSSHNGVCN